jgi:hypothetical protein
MCIGSATDRHEQFSSDRSRPFTQECPCATLALNDKVVDMRGRAIDLLS